jgi:CubicO group peptidase (beta-lactamase class C family)
MRSVRRLALLGVLSAACASPPNDPAASGGDWAVASPSSVGLDGSLLQQATDDIAAGEWGNVHALVVVRGGKLVHEAYFPGRDELWFEGYRDVAHDPSVRHGLRSVSKSFTSTLVGIAIDQGHIASVDAPLRDLLPGHAHLLTGEKSDLTLRHVLTMSTGLRWAEGGAVENDEDDDQYDLEAAADPVRMVLARESEEAPGVEFNYSTGLTQVLAGIVETTTGIPLLAYADSVLFKPLGIEDWEWFHLGNARPAAGAGLHLTARDMAKLGQVYLDHGRWQGRSIVSADWVAAAFEPWIEAPSPNSPPHVTYSAYGFQWWYDTHEWAGRSIAVHSATGNGGQRVIVVPELDLVVAVFAGFYEDPANGWTPDAIVREYVFPSVQGSVPTR